MQNVTYSLTSEEKAAMYALDKNAGILRLAMPIE